MKLIWGSELEKTIRQMLSESSFAKIAVAYWGAGATKRLLPPNLTSANTLIICDFMSGACSPVEIENLIETFGHLKRENATCGVGKLKKLHAKVWLTDKAAVLGSSNASANGLGEEGDEARNSLEANIYIEDKKLLDQIGGWFLTHISNASPITQTDINRVTAFRRTKRGKRLIESDSVLSALRADSGAFSDQNLFVWIWRKADYDKETTRVVKVEEKVRQIRGIEAWEDAKIIPPGSFIVHFDEENGRAKLSGLWQTLLDQPYVKTKSHKLLLGIKTKEQTFAQLPLGAKAEWERVANLAVQRNYIDINKPLFFTSEKFAEQYMD